MDHAVLVSRSHKLRWAALVLAVNVALLLVEGVFWKPNPFTLNLLIAIVSVNVVTIGAAMRIIRSGRRWVEVTPGGFIVTDRRGVREFHDGDVTSINLWLKSNFSQGEFQSVTRTCQLWVETPAGEEFIGMINTFKQGKTDPLNLLFERLIGGLAARAEECIKGGESFSGEGWTLESDDLLIGGKRGTDVFPLRDLAVVDVFDQAVCVWLHGEDIPAIRIPVRTANSEVLRRLLAARLAARPEPAQPPPADGLGRILFERRTSRLLLGLLWSLVGLAFTVAVSCFAVSVIVEPVFLIAAVPALGLGGLLTLFLFLQRIAFACHEFGVREVRLFGREKRLRYADIETFTYHAVRQFVNHVYAGTAFKLIFISHQGHHGSGSNAAMSQPTGKRLKISYSVTLKNADEELDHLRDLVSQLMAIPMGADLSAGNRVAWTPHLAFLPEGIEYRPAGFLGRKPPEVLPYSEVFDFRIDQGKFQLWARGTKKPLVSEDVSQPNFFPGLFLLSSVFQQRAAAPSASSAELSPPQDVRTS